MYSLLLDILLKYFIVDFKVFQECRVICISYLCFLQTSIVYLLLKKLFNRLNNANHLITKYEIKNDRLKINNLVNHVVTTYYLNFLFARRRHYIIY